MEGYKLDRDIMIISFGKNPVNGGSPLRDIMISGIRIYDSLKEDIVFCSWVWVSEDIQYIIKNIGMVRIE